jgi:xanthine dehydrogenase accessory factor
MLADALASAARRWRAGRRAAMVVEVHAHRGSVPREAGTRMLVAADAVLGSIGGGRLEQEAIVRARQRLAAPDADAVVEQRVPLGPALGQCCGGEVQLRFVPLLGDGPGADPSGWALPAPRFHLQLYGAGHVGRAIVRILEAVPCSVAWIDERESEFPAEFPAESPAESPADSPAESGPAPHIARVCVEPVEAEVALAPPGAFYLVLTHSHDLDLAIAQAVLRRGDFGWFGLIGSRSKRARFEHRLLERGVPPETLARMVCPIGLPGIGGKEPGVIAAAVVAQMLQAAAPQV